MASKKVLEQRLKSATNGVDMPSAGIASVPNVGMAQNVEAANREALTNLVPTSIKISDNEKRLLDALHRMVLLTKSEAYEEVQKVVQATTLRVAAIDQEYISQVRKIAEVYGVHPKDDDRWDYTAENGTFTRAK